LETVSHLRIASGILEAKVDPFGAELVRFMAAGKDLLWNGDPQVWSGHAPILFPIVGMLSKGKYRLNGKTFAMPKHGFVRTSLFAVVEQTASTVTLRLDESDETRAIYPYAFRLEIGFKLAGTALYVIARVTNRDAHAMPMSFGFHPAFCWPLPFGAERAEHRVTFANDEPAPIRRMNADGLLSSMARNSPVAGKTLRLRDELFVEDAIIFDDLRSRALDYGAEGTPTIALEFANLPDLGIWTKPGANFICLEPWQGYNDPEGFDGNLWAKPGIIGIAPAATREFSMIISIEGLPDDQ
jgi:galactose mutarotase-like enzyme